MKLEKYLTESDNAIVENGPRIWQILLSECRPFLKEFKKTGLAGKRWIWRGSAKNIPGKNRGIKAIIPRTDRRPKDMSRELHNKFDEDLHDVFGWYPRSEGVFTTGKRSVANSYGKPYIFFPEGKYQYIWSPDIDDLYGTADDKNLEMWSSDQVWFDDFELEHDYRSKFGEGSGNGRWEYQGEEVCDYRCDREDVKAEMEEREGEDFDVLDIEWVPDVTFDEFFDEVNQEKREEIEGEIEEVTKSYRTGNLGGAIKSGHEITFNCKAYYIVDGMYHQFLKDMINSGVYQLKLPFPPFIEKDKPRYWLKNKKGQFVYNDPIK